MEETKKPEIEIPVEVREAIAEYRTMGYGEKRLPRYVVAREKIAAWICETRAKHPLRDILGVIGFLHSDVAGWKRDFGLDMGGWVHHNPHRGPRKRSGDEIYTQKYLTTRATEEPTSVPVPAPIEKKPASRFSVRVIEMSGDDDTVQAAIQGLRDFLQTRSN